MQYIQQKFKELDMKNTISLLVLAISFAPIIGMDSWPKDKPVPFTSLPVEYYSSDDESEQTAKPLPKRPVPAAAQHDAQEEAKKTEILPWWSHGGEPSEKIIAKYQQQKSDKSSSWQWGDRIDASPEMVAKYREKPTTPYIPQGGKSYRDFCKLNETANYDDVHKSFLAPQMLFKYLCVHLWEYWNPMMMSRSQNEVHHDFFVKLKKQEIDPIANLVAMTKKDLHHRLLTNVLTDGMYCRINSKDIRLDFKQNMQNGIEGAQVSAPDYDFSADKPHHEDVMANFETILDKISRMDEVWVENPNQ